MTTNTGRVTPSATHKMPYANPTGANLRERSSAPADSLTHPQVRLGSIKPSMPLADGESDFQRIASILDPRQLRLAHPPAQDRPPHQRPGIATARRSIEPDLDGPQPRTISRSSHRSPQLAELAAAARSDVPSSPPAGRPRPASTTPKPTCADGELPISQDAADRSPSRPPGERQPPARERETRPGTQPPTQQDPSRPIASPGSHRRSRYATAHDLEVPSSAAASRPPRQRRATRCAQTSSDHRRERRVLNGLESFPEGGSLVVTDLGRLSNQHVAHYAHRREQAVKSARDAKRNRFQSGTVFADTDSLLAALKVLIIED